MNISLRFLRGELIGKTVPRPLSGTLSGHAAGEPFDKLVYRCIKKHYPTETFRQFEYLNKLYAGNPHANRSTLIQPAALAFLLSRGKEATKKWTSERPFEEKQNDTADTIVLHDGFFNIVDVKTFNAAKKGQPPNIISAFKLAQMAHLMIRERNFSSHDITYVGITWELKGEYLTCADVAIKELFKADPAKLYVNWAAALQVQFHVEQLDQSYAGGASQWCGEFLKRFVAQAKNRMDIMDKKFVQPFARL